MDRLLALDEKVFLPEHRIDATTTKQRLEINSKTDIAVFDGENLMGYVSLYPIPGDVYDQIKTGVFDEQKVEVSTLPFKRIGRYDAYLCGMAIDKESYPRFKGNYLIVQLQKHLLSLKKNGFFVNRIIAHAVSIAGKKTLLRMGFKETLSNIFVYLCCKKGLLFIRERKDFTSERYLYILPKFSDFNCCHRISGWDRDT
ncbi:hypothetical protein ACFVS2_26785 [Brevibacillus sp. NPDC058079]|uniref:hypothetical protein n=1 Tax=Brevibacillus sp. NPDC058079 TaxID=3346330 RepID=UPI0036F0F2D5